MSKNKAREIVMAATRDAMVMWANLHRENPLADMDDRLDFINAFVAGVVPEEVRNAAM